MTEQRVWIVLHKMLQYEDEQFVIAFLDEKSADNYTHGHLSDLKEGEHFSTQQ